MSHRSFRFRWQRNVTPIPRRRESHGRERTDEVSRPGGRGVSIRVRFVFACTAVIALAGSTTASAHSSVASDPQGDIATAAPSYLDIVHTKATEQIGRGTFYFQTVNADQVPATPAGFAAWNWLIDVPGGLPIDYALTVRFCSQTVQRTCGPGPWHWESSSTPMATGVSTINSFEFSVEGPTVKGFVDPSLFGDPASFRWLAATRNTPVSSGLPSVDLAPDGFANALLFER